MDQLHQARRQRLLKHGLSSALTFNRGITFQMCMIVMLIAALVIIPASIEAFKHHGIDNAACCGHRHAFSHEFRHRKMPWRLHFTRLHHYSSLVSNSREQGKISTGSMLNCPHRADGPIDATPFDMTLGEY